MTKFEQVGVNYLYNANNIYEANKSFHYSCNCCCSKGMHLSCDRCAISHVHGLVVAYFNDKNATTTKIQKKGK